MRNVQDLLSLRFNMSSLSLGLEGVGVIATSSFPSTGISNSPLSINQLVVWDRAV